MNKNAFTFNMDPSSVVGAAVGATVGNYQTKKNLEAQRLNQEQNAVMRGSYYKQVNNLANNMKISFTPFSVLIMVQDGPRLMTIDTIDTSEMSPEMHDAYESKDAVFFKNVVLNKVNTEMQMSEQSFARRIVQRQMALNDTSKVASFNIDAAESDEIGFGELLEGISIVKQAHEDNANTVLSALYNDMLSEKIAIEVNLNSFRPFEKTAGLGNPLQFFGIDFNHKKLDEYQGRLMNPSYLKDNLKVSFFPDRVLFIVDNQVITQLPSMSMNEVTYRAFERSDMDYFRKLFQSELYKRQPGRLEKSASVSGPFQESGVHPVFYMNAMIKSLGPDWIERDPFVLIKDIEDEFGLEDGIGALPLNKIFMIQLLNKSQFPFEKAKVFEKCIRAMNDLPIDFSEEEGNYSLGQMLFALEAMQAVTPNDDIFDNFSEEVIDYLGRNMVENKIVGVNVKPLIDSDSERAFYSWINDAILDVMDAGMDSDNDDASSAFKKKNIALQTANGRVVDMMRDKKIYGADQIEGIVDSICQMSGLTSDDMGKIRISAKINLASDIYLEEKQNQMKEMGV